MTQLPTNRTTASTIAEHTSDHNILCAQHNELDGHAADTAAHDLDATIAAAIDALVAAAPGTLDTLNELAAALGDDADFAATITTALAGKSATSHDHDADYEASGATATHSADTTSVHGITDTAALETTTGSAAKVAAHEADGTAAHAASAVAFTPTGTIAASNVQAALAEVDSEKATTGHNHSGTYVPLSVVDAAADLLVGTGADTIGRLAKGTALQVLRVNAGATALEYATPASGGGAPTVVRKAADETVNNSAVLQNDDELLFAIGASETWAFRIVLRTISAGLTGDLRVAITVPAGATLTFGAAGPSAGGSASPTATNQWAQVTTSGTAINGIGVSATQEHSVVLDGIVLNSTNAGNVTLQWAQSVADPTNTIIKAGSYLVAWKAA